MPRQWTDEASNFTARRYASAVYAVVVCPSACPFVCPSVHPSQVGIVSKPLDGSSWFLARRLPSTCPTQKNRVPPEIRVLPSRTLSQTLGLENFATARRLRCKQNSSTVDLVADTLSTSRGCLLHIGQLYITL